MTRTFMRLVSRAAKLAAATALLLGGFLFGTATAAHAVTGDPGWSCSVPDGCIYDGYELTAFHGLNCPGSNNALHVVVPQDMRWACTVPAGFSYDGFDIAGFHQASCASSNAFRLRAPSG